MHIHTHILTLTCFTNKWMNMIRTLTDPRMNEWNEWMNEWDRRCNSKALLSFRLYDWHKNMMPPHRLSKESYKKVTHSSLLYIYKVSIQFFKFLNDPCDINFLSEINIRDVFEDLFYLKKWQIHLSPFDWKHVNY